VLRPGDQIVADGRLVEARGLQVDESILTGESDPDARRVGETVQSGSFCVAGSGIYEAEKVGADAYANELTGVAREDRRELSPLQLSINRLLRLMVALMIPISVLLLYALHVHEVPTREAVSTSVAGIVSLVPEGLVLLASLVFAVAATRVGRRGALVQRLPAVEALAGLDIVCLDKTGTLTDGTLAVEEILPVSGVDEREVRALVGMFSASLGSRNPTADALHAQLGGATEPVSLEVPFSSRWKWSGIVFADGTQLVLGAPEVILRAENEHEKEYVVTVDRPVTDDFVRAMARGVPMLGTITNRCEVERIAKNTFRIVLTQGMNRQIRRMCRHFGYTVRRLRRVRIMNVRLGRLASGAWRPLTSAELAGLAQAIGPGFLSP
jgi:cation-transporting ATPase E